VKAAELRNREAKYGSVMKVESDNEIRLDAPSLTFFFVDVWAHVFGGFSLVASLPS
jgi:hypothetical protein